MEKRKRLDKDKKWEKSQQLIRNINFNIFQFLFALVDKYDKEYLREGKDEPLQDSVEKYIATQRAKKIQGNI